MTNQNRLSPNIPLLIISGIVAFGILNLGLLIITAIYSSSFPAIQKLGLKAVWQSSWNPIEGNFGLLEFITGTIYTSIIAIIIALPIGIIFAIVLSSFSVPIFLKRLLVFLLELQASIPGIVYGLWGIYFLIPLVFMKPSLLAASIILAIIILPTLTAVCTEFLTGIPERLCIKENQLETSEISSSPRELILTTMLGILAGVLLTASRAIGEAMAVTMLIGNSSIFSNSSLLKPSNTITSLLINQFPEANGLQASALMYAALVLLIMVIVLSGLGELLISLIRKSSIRVLKSYPIRVKEYPRRIKFLITTLVIFLILIIFQPLFSILQSTYKLGFSRLSIDFFTKLPPPPGVTDGGIGNAILGTTMMVGSAISWSIPIGIMTGVFLYLSPNAQNPILNLISWMIKVLTTFPSVIIGIYIYTLLVVPHGAGSGFSAIAGSNAIGVWIIFIMTRMTFE
jgi:phosphate transport system permease protein